MIAAATVLLLAGCIPSGPPTPDQLIDQFAETVKPAWEVDVDGIFGEPVVRDGLVFAYAIDEADGMRLEVRSLKDGKLVWKHAASPGGAYSNPILESVDSASRAYPLPAPDAKDAQFVTPRYVGEVEFSEWTPTKKLRHPVWRGWRPDKAPDEVVLED